MGVVGLGPWSKLMLAVGNWMRISKAALHLLLPIATCKGLGGGFHLVSLTAPSVTAHNTWMQWRLESTQSSSLMLIAFAIFCTMKPGSSELKTLYTDVRQTFQELQDSALEQRVVFAEIFNRVTFLHRFVVGESSALYSLLFHILSGIASLVLTSCQRTSGARFILLTLVGVNIYLERAICSFLVDNSEDDYGLTESISFWVGMLRRGFAGLGFAVVAYFIRTYKDPAKQSQVVLQSLQETQADIQRLLQETERLLPNKTEVLLHESVLSAEDEALFIDSGFPEQLFSSDCGAEIQGHKTWRGQSPSRLCRSLSRQRSKIRTSSPKRRGRSPSRKCRSPSRRLSRTRSSAAQQLKIPVLQEGMHSQTRTSSPKQRGRSPSHKCYSPSRHLSRSRSSATQ
ncbi:uncharacterized protein LOC100565946 isoform X3 [Anolis carolinensis]|uniref:uncharacterized protein LOC100565946 isoform X3 n=1 Tax=Anolis carolinensis TaxID=28377 RepID=UPI002F2B55FC